MIGDQKYFAIVMEAMDGTLEKYLENNGSLNEEQAIKWLNKIVSSYKCLY